MAKKKKEIEEIKEEKPKTTKREVKEVKFKPTEWAIQKGDDPDLVLYWANQLMNEKEYDKLIKEIRGE